MHFAVAHISAERTIPVGGLTNETSGNTWWTVLWTHLLLCLHQFESVEVAQTGPLHKQPRFYWQDTFFKQKFELILTLCGTETPEVRRMSEIHFRYVGDSERKLFFFFLWKRQVYRTHCERKSTGEGSNVSLWKWELRQKVENLSWPQQNGDCTEIEKQQRTNMQLCRVRKCNTVPFRWLQVCGTKWTLSTSCRSLPSPRLSTTCHVGVHGEYSAWISSDAAFWSWSASWRWLGRQQVPGRSCNVKCWHTRGTSCSQMTRWRATHRAPFRSGLETGNVDPGFLTGFFFPPPQVMPFSLTISDILRARFSWAKISPLPLKCHSFIHHLQSLLKKNHDMEEKNIGKDVGGGGPPMNFHQNVLYSPYSDPRCRGSRRFSPCLVRTRCTPHGQSPRNDRNPATQRTI